MTFSSVSKIHLRLIIIIILVLLIIISANRYFSIKKQNQELSLYLGSQYEKVVTEMLYTDLDAFRSEILIEEPDVRVLLTYGHVMGRKLYNEGMYYMWRYIQPLTNYLTLLNYKFNREFMTQMLDTEIEGSEVEVNAHQKEIETMLEQGVDTYQKILEYINQQEGNRALIWFEAFQTPSEEIVNIIEAGLRPANE